MIKIGVRLIFNPSILISIYFLILIVYPRTNVAEKPIVVMMGVIVVVIIMKKQAQLLLLAHLLIHTVMHVTLTWHQSMLKILWIKDFILNDLYLLGTGMGLHQDIKVHMLPSQSQLTRQLRNTSVHLHTTLLDRTQLLQVKLTKILE